MQDKPGMQAGKLWRFAHLLGPLCIVVIFASVLFGRDRLAFRDVGYFYTPLYQFVDDQCDRQSYGAFGHAIWNDHDQTGMPLAGETSTAVFYPLRMLAYAPAWSAETAMAVYVVLHLIIASLTAFHAARCFHCDRWSAAIAGVVYPLSGMVLFLATNPPFLVGAAWLPLLMSSMLKISASRILPAAVAMSLIVLGGDPPTALHALIVASFIHAVRWAANLWRHRSGIVTGICKTYGQMIAVCLLAALLSAPQIAASWAWSACSDRVQYADGSIPVEISKIRSQAFAFSVPASRLAELCIPNLYGTPWPVNTRWDRLWFDAGRVRPETALWTPTLYSGLLLPVLLVLGGVSCSRRRRDSIMTLWGILVMGIVTSMGLFGPTFGLLHAYFPGYDSLRYPSKWLPFAALAIAILSAIAVRRQRTWTRWQAGRPWLDVALGWPRVLLITLVVGLVVVGCVSAAIGIPRLRGITSDPFWGPFLPTLAQHQFLVSATHSMLVLAAILLLKNSRWLLVVVSMELVVAHYGLVPRVNRMAESQILETANLTTDRLPSVALDALPLRWLRVHQNGEFPDQWSEQSDSDRMLIVEAGLRHARFGRWHLEQDQAVVNSMVSIGTRELAEFWHYSREVSRAEKLPYDRSWRGWCRLLRVDGFLRCRGGKYEMIRSSSQETLPLVTYDWFEVDADVNRAPLKCRIQSSVIALPEDRASAWRQILLAFAEGRPEMPAFVDREVGQRVATAKQEGDPLVLVSRPVYQDGYWQAVLTPRDGNGPVVETNVFAVDFLSQGVLCPPGKWRVTFHYAPWWHRPALLIAMVAWCGVLGCWGVGRFSPGFDVLRTVGTMNVARLSEPNA